MPIKQKAELSAEFVKSILDYDPETGIIKWRHNPKRLPRWNKKHAGKPAGCSVRGYIQVRILDYGCYPAHRLAWLIMTGTYPPDVIDHKNGDPSDNRFDNLRACAQGENSCNRKMQSNNTSGFVGVRYRPHHRKWEARIVKAGKLVWRCYAATAQEAAAARRNAIESHHGEFARH